MSFPPPKPEWPQLMERASRHPSCRQVAKNFKRARLDLAGLDDGAWLPSDSKVSMTKSTYASCLRKLREHVERAEAEAAARKAGP